MSRLRNTHVPAPGDTVVFCGVPEVDYDNGIYHEAIVAEVWDDMQVILTNGDRTGVAYVWQSVEAIAQAVETRLALMDIDERMLRNAY